MKIPPEGIGLSWSVTAAETRAPRLAPTPRDRIIVDRPMYTTWPPGAPGLADCGFGHENGGERADHVAGRHLHALRLRLRRHRADDSRESHCGGRACV